MAKTWDQVTREEFVRYERVRLSGACNMYSMNVEFLADLDRETHLRIIESYEKLVTKFPGVRPQLCEGQVDN